MATWMSGCVRSVLRELSLFKIIFFLLFCSGCYVVIYRETLFFSQLPKLRYYHDALKTGREDVGAKRASNSVIIPTPRASAIHCKDFITGNYTELMKIYPFATSIERVIKPDSFFSSYASRCKHFLSERAYIMDDISAEEKDFPIAFGILMYKDVEQVERLLRTIYRPQNYYCIHVDAKSSNKTKDAMQTIAKCFENVFIASKYVNVTWGKFSLLEADMLCMKDLIRFHWKYYINLTGQEFPLKTNLEIVKILKSYNGTNDISGYSKGVKKQRFRGLEHKLPPGIVLFKGEIHIAASWGFVNFTLNDKFAKYFLKWVKQTEIPDETFYPTLGHNPHLGIPGSDSGNAKPFMARYKNWDKQHPCAGKWVREICVFGLGDIQLLTSRREMFANKFHYDYQPLAYDCMEEWISNKTRDEYLRIKHSSTDFYANFSFVKHHA